MTKIIIVLIMLNLLILVSLINLVSTNKLITLDNNNFVSLRGPVTSSSIGKLISELLLLTFDIRYIYLNTNGGSVDAGLELLNAIDNLAAQNIEVSCIADTAISMGFVIFQACNHRYVTKYATLMQHQMSLSGIEGKLYDINSHIEFINQIEVELNTMQANKIRMCPYEFKKRITSNWWLTSNTALKYNVADEIVNIKCSVNIMKEHVIINDSIGDINITYMKCPLISTPVKIDYDKNIPAEKIKDILIKYRI